jgi:hypothetical protein
VIRIERRVERCARTLHESESAPPNPRVAEDRPGERS